MEARIHSRYHSLPSVLEILFIHLSLCVCAWHNTCGGQRICSGIPESTLVHRLAWHQVSPWSEPSLQPPSCFLSLNLEITDFIWVSCLASESQGSSSLCLPSAKLADINHYALPFVVGGDLNLVFMLIWQTLYRLSHLLCPRKCVLSGKFQG